MKKLIFIAFVVMIMLFSFGCGKSKEDEVLELAEETLNQMQDKMKEMPTGDDMNDALAEMESEDTEDETDEEESEETTTEDIEEESGCVSTLEAHQVDHVELDIDTTDLVVDDEGFSFRVFPMSVDGEVIPLTGNVKVEIFPTTINDDAKGREVDGKVIYLKSFYKKIDDVLDDCGTTEIHVSFDDSKWDPDRLNMAEDGDPGLMIVTLKTSNQEYEVQYMPWKHDVESILPQS